MSYHKQKMQNICCLTLIIVFLNSAIGSASEVIYSNPRLFHVRHTGCTYNKNITTMTHLELNISLPENWPDCQVSNVKISGDEPFLLHNTEGPGQIYRTVYKNGLPHKGTIALVCVEYDVQLYEVNINFAELAKQTFPEYKKDSEYEYCTRLPPDNNILADEPQIQRILKIFQRESNGNPVLYAKAVYDWIAKNIKYVTPPPGDLKICLRARKGDCGVIAALFVDFCRRAGIPTRFVAGCWAGNLDGWHCWAEFLVPGIGWIPIDHSGAGGFGHLSNNHLPLVKAGNMKFNVNENKGSKDSGCVQQGYWWFVFAGGTEGNHIDTEFSVESFAYPDMPRIGSPANVKKIYEEADISFNKTDYNRALQIYRYLILSNCDQDKNGDLCHYRIAKCFYHKNQHVKAALELLPLIKKTTGSETTKDAEKLFRRVRREVLYIDELNLSNIRQGWGSPHNNQSVEGKPISIGGEKFKRGIGTHSESICVFDTNNSIEEFSAYAGVDDEVEKGRGSVEFFVTGDGKILWQSGIMRGGEQAKPVKVETKNIKKLILKVSDANDGGIGDHADWAEAKLIIEGIYPTIVPVGNGD